MSRRRSNNEHSSEKSLQNSDSSVGKLRIGRSALPEVGDSIPAQFDVPTKFLPRTQIEHFMPAERVAHVQQKYSQPPEDLSRMLHDQRLAEPEQHVEYSRHTDPSSYDYNKMEQYLDDVPAHLVSVRTTQGETSMSASELLARQEAAEEAANEQALNNEQKRKLQADYEALAAKRLKLNDPCVYFINGSPDSGVKDQIQKLYQKTKLEERMLFIGFSADITTMSPTDGTDITKYAANTRPVHGKETFFNKKPVDSVEAYRDASRVISDTLLWLYKFVEAHKQDVILILASLPRQLRPLHYEKSTTEEALHGLTPDAPFESSVIDATDETAKIKLSALEVLEFAESQAKAATSLRLKNATKNTPDAVKFNGVVQMFDGETKKGENGNYHTIYCCGRGGTQHPASDQALSKYFLTFLEAGYGGAPGFAKALSDTTSYGATYAADVLAVLAIAQFVSDWKTDIETDTHWTRQNIRFGGADGTAVMGNMIVPLTTKICTQTQQVDTAPFGLEAPGWDIKHRRRYTFSACSLKYDRDPLGNMYTLKYGFDRKHPARDTAAVEPYWLALKGTAAAIKDGEFAGLIHSSKVASDADCNDCDDFGAEELIKKITRKVHNARGKLPEMVPNMKIHAVCQVLGNDGLPIDARAKAAAFARKNA